MVANAKSQSRTARKVTTSELKAWLKQQGVADDKHNEVIGRQILQAIYDGKPGLANALMIANPPDMPGVKQTFTNTGDPSSSRVAELFGLGPDEDYPDNDGI